MPGHAPAAVHRRARTPTPRALAADQELRAVDQLETNAAVASGDECLLAVAAGIELPRIHSRRWADSSRLPRFESCRLTRYADKSGAQPNDTQRPVAAHFGGHVQEKDDHEHQEGQADHEAECGFARPDPPAKQAEAREESHEAISA